MELVEGSPSLVVLRALVGPLKPPSPRGLLGLRQVAHHVLAFVPLATLDPGSITECSLVPRADLCRRRRSPARLQRCPGLVPSMTAILNLERPPPDPTDQSVYDLDESAQTAGLSSGRRSHKASEKQFVHRAIRTEFLVAPKRNRPPRCELEAPEPAPAGHPDGRIAPVSPAPQRRLLSCDRERLHFLVERLLHGINASGINARIISTFESNSSPRVFLPAQDLDLTQSDFLVSSPNVTDCSSWLLSLTGLMLFLPIPSNHRVWSRFNFRLAHIRELDYFFAEDSPRNGWMASAAAPQSRLRGRLRLRARTRDLNFPAVEPLPACSRRRSQPGTAPARSHRPERLPNRSDSGASGSSTLGAGSRR